MAKRTAELDIKATDKTKAAFSSVDKSMKQMGKGGTFLTKNLGSLSVAMGTMATNALMGLKDALISTIKNIIGMGDELQKTGLKLNLAVEDLQNFRRVMEFSGVQANAFDKAVLNMNKTIGEASQGIGLGIRAFEELGISMDDLSTMNTAESFTFLIDKLKGVQNESKRQALGQAVLGGSMKELAKIVNDTGTNFADFSAEVASSATYMSQEAADSYARAADNMASLGHSAGNVGNAIRNSLAPAVEGFTSMLVRLVTGTSSAQQKLDELGKTDLTGLGQEGLVGGIIEARDLVKELEAELVSLQRETDKGFAAFIPDSISKSVEESIRRVTEELDIANKEMDKFAEESAKAILGVSAVINEDLVMSIEELLVPTEEALKAARELTDGYEGLATTGVEAMELAIRGTEQASAALTENTTKIDESKIAQQEYKDEIISLNKQLLQTNLIKSEEDKINAQLTASQEMLNHQRGIEIGLLTSRNSLVDASVEADARVENVNSGGGGGSAKVEAESLDAKIERLKLVNEQLFRGLELNQENAEAIGILMERELELGEQRAALQEMIAQNLIDEITGKEMLLELDTQIAANMQEQIDLRAGVTDSISDMTNEITVASSAGDMMMSSFDSAFDLMLSGTEDMGAAFAKMAQGILADLAKMIIKQMLFNSLKGTSFGGFMGFASGGIIPAGQTSMVGESGPELITPASDTMVVPNSALGSAASNSGNSSGDSNNVVNITIIDNTTGEGVDASVTQEEDSEAQVIKVVLTDLRHSGPISNGIAKRFRLTERPR